MSWKRTLTLAGLAVAFGTEAVIALDPGTGGKGTTAPTAQTDLDICKNAANTNTAEMATALFSRAKVFRTTDPRVTKNSDGEKKTIAAACNKSGVIVYYMSGWQAGGQIPGKPTLYQMPYQAAMNWAKTTLKYNNGTGFPAAGFLDDEILPRTAPPKYVAGSYNASHSEIQALFADSSTVNIGVSTKGGIVCEGSCQPFFKWYAGTRKKIIIVSEQGAFPFP
jgi:hypothetical protein